MMYIKLLDAKEAFKLLLVQHNGDATHPDVNIALQQLIQLDAKNRAEVTSDDQKEEEWSPAYSMDANNGLWRSITTPPFPGKLLPDSNSDGKSRFTLGRMSFGMFKPTKLVCAVEKIVNIIHQVVDHVDDEEEEEVVVEVMGKEENQKDAAGHNIQTEWKQSYNIQVMMEIETTSGKIPAKLTNYGICFPKSATRLGVIFSSGILEPDFDVTKKMALTALWKETFDVGIAREAETQSYASRLLSMVTYKVMNLMMGLEPPTYDGINLSQTFKIGRPFTGHLDIIYLDDDLRVTRGNKGTIVVAERVKCMAEEDQE